MNLQSLTDKLSGKHTAAVTLFSTVGTIMHWFHRLDSTYISFVTVMMGFVAGRSIQADLIGNKDKDGSPSKS